MARVLLVRNKYDPMTSYMHDWSEPFISECGKRGIKVDLIDEKEVIRSNLESRIRGVNYSFIFLNGHGDNSCFCGYEGKVVISNENAHVFFNSVVFARACNCLEVLGKVSVEKHKCRCFVGYRDAFTNVRQKNVELTPIQDSVSRPIWDTSNMVPISLTKGSTVDQAIESSHKKATHEIIRILKNIDEPGSSQVLGAIISNDSVLGYEGDGNAKI